MKKGKALTARFGPISSCTMRPEDLIPNFAWELDILRNGTNKAHRALATRARNLKIAPDGYYKDEEAAGYVLDELFEALDDYAPVYAYFGASPYDGADYGFYLSEDFEQEFEGYEISDPSELDDLPAMSGNVYMDALYVNDHGNMTLYAAYTRGRKTTWREVWSLV
jgi:hypothetical protein